MAGKKRSPQQVRIIGGKWKGRKLQFRGGASLRPTLGRTRETLFSWLRPHIHETRCLDAFAGSGILGFEALSQGAASVVFVEQDARSLKSLTSVITQLSAANRAEVVGGDTLSYLRREETPFDVVFLDPPFDRPALLAESMNLLRERKLVTQYVYAEAPRVEQLEQAAAVAEMTIIKRTRTGASSAALLMPESFAARPTRR